MVYGQATVGQGRQNVLGSFATCGPLYELAGTLYRGAFWLVSDRLGTPRMIVNKGGTLVSVKRHDYLPFGEELSSVVGLRSSSQGYSAADAVRQKFTQKERDIETGLDYFGARYYSSTQGRFTGADPLLSSGKEEDPQSWNRYAYCLNNPLALTDATGLYVFDSHVTEDERKKFNAGLTQARANLAKIADVYGPNSQEYNKAKRSLDAYGAEGVKNGVTIFEKSGAYNPLDTQVAGTRVARTADNPTGQNIHVNVNKDAFGSVFLGDMIGHEGTHVADGSDWVKSGFANSMNPTVYRGETDAYTVQSLLAEARAPNRSFSMTLPYYKEPGKNPYFPQNPPIWKPEWEGADRATLQAFRGSVDQVLSRSKKAGGYGVTSASPDRMFRRGSSFPR